jgi:hypothetical protein
VRGVVSTRGAFALKSWSLFRLVPPIALIVLGVLLFAEGAHASKFLLGMIVALNFVGCAQQLQTFLEEGKKSYAVVTIVVIVIATATAMAIIYLTNPR